jgi:hypothetical protein
MSRDLYALHWLLSGLSCSRGPTDAAEWAAEKETPPANDVRCREDPTGQRRPTASLTVVTEAKGSKPRSSMRRFLSPLLLQLGSLAVSCPTAGPGAHAGIVRTVSEFPDHQTLRLLVGFVKA